MARRFDRCHGRSQHADAALGSRHRRSDFEAPGGDARRQHQGTRRQGVFPVSRRATGDRPRHRAGAGCHAAGDDRRVRRLPHEHPRRVRLPRVRHRHERSRACARDAVPPDTAIQGDARQRERRTPVWLHRQGHRARDHRQNRDGRRHRLRHRVRRVRDPRVVDGRPHDGVQHDDRRRRARRA